MALSHFHWRDKDIAVDGVTRRHEDGAPFHTARLMCGEDVIFLHLKPYQLQYLICDLIGVRDQWYGDSIARDPDRLNSGPEASTPAEQ